MAAYYPERPDEQTQKDMSNYMKLFGKFYPCKTCAFHYNNDIKKDPPKTQSRESFSVWMCVQHNNVNRILGKSQFDCSYDNLIKRWKKGGPECKPSNIV